MPDDIGTDDTSGVGLGPGANPNRWGRAGEETPGGVAVLEDGSINTERFSEGPETELEVQWWDKRMLWQVRREPTGHRVVVARVVEHVWRIHIMIAGAIIALAVVGVVVVGGLPVMYALVLAVVLALIGYGTLAWERRAGDETAGIEEIIEMDSVMWVGVRNKVRSEYLAYTEEGQKRRYDEAIEIARTRYDKKFGDPATGKVGKTYAAGGKVLPVPKFVVPPEITQEFLNKATRLGPDTVVEKIKTQLSPGRLEGHRKTLLARYRRDPKLVEAMGRGVLRCECAACKVQTELGIIPDLSGAEASRRRAAAAALRQAQAGPADPATGLDQVRRAAERLRGTDKQDTPVGPVESKEAAKARKALAKTAETTRKREETRAAQEEKDAVRAAREASRARVTGGAPDMAATEQFDSGQPIRPATKKKKGHGAIIGVAAVVGVMVIGLVVAIVVASKPEAPKTPTITLPEGTVSTSVPTTSTRATPSTPPPPPTNGEVAGVPITFGPENAGGQNGGAEVIAAYDYAYYVKRSGAEAVAMYAPGAQPNAGQAQNAIDANPEGTRYQLVITPVVVGKEYDVLLKVIWPGLPETEARQKFFTTYSDGKYFLLRQAS
ncbi:MAG: hypothetical protein DI630_00535 [Gordonia sp. (in: high G+C Gram-positive bacteria)]|nr:MAG: hypothetical protein DI630_00535 [Gordonia sp. (in: high G+C Gram-positive bacteria)]